MALVAALVVGGGLFAVWFYFWVVMPRQDRAAAASWPTAPAVVTRAYAARHQQQRSRSYYSPVVEYAFTANGAEHTGARASFINLTWLSEDQLTNQLQRDYPAGKAITVRYNPADPRQSVIDPPMVKA